jgi:hypothetical protein
MSEVGHMTIPPHCCSWGQERLTAQPWSLKWAELEMGYAQGVPEIKSVFGSKGEKEAGGEATAPNSHWLYHFLFWWLIHYKKPQLTYIICLLPSECLCVVLCNSLWRQMLITCPLCR